MKPQKNKVKKQPITVIISDGSSEQQVASNGARRNMFIRHRPSQAGLHVAAIKTLENYRICFTKGTSKETVKFYQEQLTLKKVVYKKTVKTKKSTNEYREPGVPLRTTAPKPESGQ